MLEAAGLIARLQGLCGVAWPQQNGIVSARGSLWLVSVSSGAPGAVAFARAGSGGIEAQPQSSKSILTNAGGRWHVAVR